MRLRNQVASSLSPTREMAAAIVAVEEETVVGAVAIAAAGTPRLEALLHRNRLHRAHRAGQGMRFGTHPRRRLGAVAVERPASVAERKGVRMLPLARSRVHGMADDPSSNRRRRVMQASGQIHLSFKTVIELIERPR